MEEPLALLFDHGKGPEDRTRKKKKFGPKRKKVVLGVDGLEAVRDIEVSSTLAGAGGLYLPPPPPESHILELSWSW